MKVVFDDVVEQLKVLCQPLSLRLRSNFSDKFVDHVLRLRIDYLVLIPSINILVSTSFSCREPISSFSSRLRYPRQRTHVRGQLNLKKCELHPPQHLAQLSRKLRSAYIDPAIGTKLHNLSADGQT